MQWLKDRKIHNGPFSLFFVIPAFYASLSHRLEPASSLNKGQMGQALVRVCPISPLFDNSAAQRSCWGTVSNTNCPLCVDFPECGILFASADGPSGHTCSELTAETFKLKAFFPAHSSLGSSAEQTAGCEARQDWAEGRWPRRVWSDSGPLGCHSTKSLELSKSYRAPAAWPAPLLG